MSFKFYLIFLFWGNILAALANLFFHFSTKGYIPWYIVLLAIFNFLISVFILYVLKKDKSKQDILKITKENGVKKLNE